MARAIAVQERKEDCMELAIAMFLILLLGAGVIWGFVVFFVTPKVSPGLLRTLGRMESSTDIAVNFGWNRTAFGGRRGEDVFSRLGSRLVLAQPSLMWQAKKSQYRVQDFLSRKAVPFESLWISNQLVVPGARLHLVEELAEFPEVMEIYDARAGTLYEYNLEFNMTSKAVTWIQKNISFKFYIKGEAITAPAKLFGGGEYDHWRYW